jgi:hypothetical protein
MDMDLVLESRRGRSTLLLESTSVAGRRWRVKLCSETSGEKRSPLLGFDRPPAELT